MFLTQDVIKQGSLARTEIAWSFVSFKHYGSISDKVIPVTSVIGTRSCAGVSNVVDGVVEILGFSESGSADTSTSSGGASSSSIISAGIF
jgi:hypothetical protein